MGNIVGLDLNVDQDYLAEAVKQSVMLGISESLNGKNEIVSQIVSMVLNTKVNGAGNISQYPRDNTQTLLEYYVRTLIKEVTTDEIKALVEEHRKDISDAIRKELSKKATAEKFANVFIDNVSKAVDSSWCPKIDVIFEKEKGPY